jgi:predicted amidohydrolase
MADQQPMEPAAWTIAGVQMDVRLGDRSYNLAAIRSRLRTAADRGARLILFPECALTGYGFESKAAALRHAEPLPGPLVDALADDCRRLGVWVIVGLLERAGDDLFNASVLVGPDGFIAGYRKLHLPFVGVDRFTTPGDRPLAVHDVGGLRIGMLICYDGSLPEPARVLMLQGADLVTLPTNWAAGAEGTIDHLVRCRALENKLYYAAVNRIGIESGYRYLGRSQFISPDGELLANQPDDADAILYAEVRPARARDKRVIRIPGEYELHRLRDRRPEMYGPLCVTNRTAARAADVPQQVAAADE